MRASIEDYSSKSRLIALLLCWFLGYLGIHRFYLGKVKTGILMILTLGGLGVWTFIDLILLLLGSFRDGQRRQVRYWFEPYSIITKSPHSSKASP